MGLMDHSVKVIADGFIVFVGRHHVYNHDLQMRSYIEVDSGVLLQSVVMGVLELNVCNL
jgi:hypothetical protein